MAEIYNQLRADATREEILADASSHFETAYNWTRRATLELLPRFKSRKDLADHI